MTNAWPLTESGLLQNESYRKLALEIGLYIGKIIQNSVWRCTIPPLYIFKVLVTSVRPDWKSKNVVEDPGYLEPPPHCFLICHSRYLQLTVRIRLGLIANIEWFYNQLCFRDWSWKPHLESEQGLAFEILCFCGFDFRSYSRFSINLVLKLCTHNTYLDGMSMIAPSG